MATSDDARSSSAPVDASGGDDPDRTVEAAYDAISAVLVERLDLPAGTHWEVVDGAEAAGVDGDALDALRRLVTLYERAVYAPDPVPAEDARWAATVATRFSDLVESAA